MKEITGDLWDYYNKENYIICITTNGTITSKGLAVMGRGCALQATKIIPRIRRVLANAIRSRGNIINYIMPNVLSFPVKHNWDEQADIKLILHSASTLKHIALSNPNNIYILPRPGCGNGHLTWSYVKPFIADILPENVLVISYGTE